MVLRLRVQHSARQLLRAFENESVGAGRGGLEQAKLCVVDARIGCNLGKVAAHQREVMTLVDATNPPNALKHLGIADMPDQ